MKKKPFKQFAAAGCLGVVSAFGQIDMTHAESPGRGQIGPFEVSYFESIIDHHYSALQMTELAAGTDPVRGAPVSSGGNFPRHHKPSRQPSS